MALPAEGLGQLQPVGVAERQIGVMLEFVVLLPGNQAVATVFPDQHHDVGIQTTGGFHFLHIHQEAAIATDRQNLALRPEEHTSELQSLMRTSYAVLCLKKKKK